MNAWGNPRLTQDIDFSLLTGFGEERAYVEKLFALLEPRIPNAMEFALISRVLLAKTKSGIPVYIGFAGLPYEEEFIERAETYNVGEGNFLRVVAPDDLVLLKAFANRLQDWADLDELITRQAKRLNWVKIRERLEMLCTAVEVDDPLIKLDALLAERKRKGR